MINRMKGLEKISTLTNAIENLSHHSMMKRQRIMSEVSHEAHSHDKEERGSHDQGRINQIIAETRNFTSGNTPKEWHGNVIQEALNLHRMSRNQMPGMQSSPTSGKLCYPHEDIKSKKNEGTAGLSVHMGRDYSQPTAANPLLDDPVEMDESMIIDKGEISDTEIRNEIPDGSEIHVQPGKNFDFSSIKIDEKVPSTR